jgi:nicotinic acid mononucleotide adenylyltransferase
MRHYPNYEFVFVAGMDTLARLDGWSDIQTVVDKASFAIARRPGASDESIAALKLRLGELGDHLDVRVFNFDDHASVASTRIRELLKLSKRPDSIDGNVYDYILQNHLYR